MSNYLRLKNIVLLIIATLSLSVFAEPLSKKDIKNLSYNKLQKLRYSYIQFVIEAEKDFPSKMTQIFIDFGLIKSAYANDGSLCFFGGWPSKFEGRYCRAPWKKKDDQLVQEYGGYQSNSHCGANDEFRCNPILFGKPKEGLGGIKEVNGVTVNYSPAKNGNESGYCVKNGGSYAELTQKCEKASRDSIDDLIASYQEDPTQLDEFTQAISDFCNSKPNYDACDDLAKRVKDITGKDIGTFASSGTPERTINSGSDSKDSAADHVLRQCKQMMQDDELSDSRDIFEKISLDTSDCVPKEVANLNEIEDFEKLAGEVEKQKVLTEVNKVNLKNSLKALMVNQAKFSIDSGLDMSSKTAFFESLKEKLPSYSEDLYKESVDEVYDEVDALVKSGQLIPLDNESVRDQFNHYANEVNALCKDIHHQYDGSRSYLSRNWGWYRRTFANSQEEEFYTTNKPLIEGKIKELFDKSEIAHLMGTDKFKSSVMDPSEHFVEECAVNENYKVIQSPVSQSTITAAHSELKEKVKENIRQSHKAATAVKGGNSLDIEDYLKKLIKQDPGGTLAAIELADPDFQAAMAANICTEAVDITKTDQNWRYVNWGLAGIGTAAGAILIASGVGAPIGAGLVAGSTALVTTAAIGEGYLAYDKYMDAKMRERGVDNAVMERRGETLSHLDQYRLTHGQKVDSYLQGGLAAVGVIPGLKVFTSSSKGVTSGTGIVLANSGDVVRAGGGSRSVVRSTAGRARGGSSTGSRWRSSGSGTGSKTASRGAGSTNPSGTRSVIDDVGEVMGDVTNYTTKNIDDLKSINKLSELPSEVLIKTLGKDQAKLWNQARNGLTKSDAEKFFKKMAESLGDPNMKVKDVYRKLMGKFHPDKLPNATEGVQGLAKQETAMLNALIELTK